MKADDDFEDREGHQAPFTLRLQLSLSAASPRESVSGLFDLGNERVKVRPFAGTEFGMERFSIGADFECAAAGRNQRERRYALAEIENLGRQTDGLGRVVSDHAILDPDFSFHRRLLSFSEISGKGNRVKEAEGGGGSSRCARAPPNPFRRRHQSDRAPGCRGRVRLTMRHLRLRVEQQSRNEKQDRR